MLAATEGWDNSGPRRASSGADSWSDPGLRARSRFVLDGAAAFVKVLELLLDDARAPVDDLSWESALDEGASRLFFPPFLPLKPVLEVACAPLDSFPLSLPLEEVGAALEVAAPREALAPTDTTRCELSPREASAAMDSRQPSLLFDEGCGSELIWWLCESWPEDDWTCWLLLLPLGADAVVDRPELLDWKSSYG